MKNWQEAKQAFIKEHLSKSLKAPNIRLSVLTKIENAIQTEEPEYLMRNNIFKKFEKKCFFRFLCFFKRNTFKQR
jgi:hypothetical protein